MDILKLLSKRQEVSSSTGLQWVGFIPEFSYYDEDEDETSEPTPALMAGFESALYLFTGVTEELYNELLEASSIGSFFAKNIRDKFVTHKSTNNGEDWQRI